MVWATLPLRIPYCLVSPVQAYWSLDLVTPDSRDDKHFPSHTLGAKLSTLHDSFSQHLFWGYPSPIPERQSLQCWTHSFPHPSVHIYLKHRPQSAGMLIRGIVCTSPPHGICQYMPASDSVAVQTQTRVDPQKEGAKVRRALIGQLGHMCIPSTFSPAARVFAKRGKSSKKCGSVAQKQAVLEFIRGSPQSRGSRQNDVAARCSEPPFPTRGGQDDGS